MKTPSTNLQAPEKLKASNSKTACRIRPFWCLKFEVSLELGAWNLEL
jgi:hypothetical protein